MKRSDLTFGALLVPLDFIMLVVAGLAAYFVRFSRFYLENIREATVTIKFPEYIGLVLAISLVWLIVFALAGLYNLRTYRKIWDEVAKVILACSTGILIVVIFIFLNRELFASRFVVLAAWILAILFVSLGRLMARGVQRRFLKKGVGVHNIIVVGQNSVADTLINLLRVSPGHGLNVVHHFPDFSPDKARLLSELVRQEQIDEILLADPNLPQLERQQLLDAVGEYHLNFKYAADLLGLARINTEIETLAGIPIVEVKKTALEGWGRIGKRVFDLVLAGLALILLAPLFLILSAFIKLGSKGSIFYVNQRIGGKGKKFGLLKFRSMVQEAEKMKEQLLAQNERGEGPLFKMKDDPRITGVGKFIRRWSLDELPQLINVLRGEISLVGPRPHEPHEVAQYEKHHKRLLDIKPGITGLAQVSGRSDLPFEDEVKLDVYYIENWSLWLDLKILLQTPRAVLVLRKAE